MLAISPAIIAPPAPLTAPLTAPVTVKAEEDLGALMLHFTVDGRDRLFFVDSGASISTYDPTQWTLKKGQSRLKFDLLSGKTLVASVTPFASQGMPLYHSTFTRPAGILGRDFFNQVVLLFDRRSETALLWPAKTATVQTALSTLSLGSESLAWSVTNCRVDDNGALDVGFSIDSETLVGTLDTGCSDTVIAVKNLRALNHWPYAEMSDALWDQDAAQSFSLVTDLRLPFLEVPIASVGDMAGDPLVAAWIGEDCLNQGRWVMDIAHRQFAFQPYDAKPDVRLHLPGSDLLIKSDGSYALRPQFRNPVSYRLAFIQSQEPGKTLGPYPSASLSRDRVASLAQSLKTLLAKRLSMNYFDGSTPAIFMIHPWKRGGLQTIEQIAVQRNLVPDLSKLQPAPTKSASQQ